MASSMLPQGRRVPHKGEPLAAKPFSRNVKLEIAAKIRHLPRAKSVHMVGCAAGCGSPGGSVCSGCRAVYYCGPDCQHRDWPLHKPLCTALKGPASAKGGPDASRTLAVVRAPVLPQPSVLSCVVVWRGTM
jgi:hypothetical protein